MKIVVGFDGSEHAQRALERAADMAGQGDELVVVAAAELQARTGITEGARLDPSTVQHQHDAMGNARALLSERGIDAEVVEAQGDPGTAIVDTAKAKGADLIIVGTRGLNPMQRILLGSVSSKVVHRAECDVLVIR
jgi:nucleotide-binding universal stress UspA family protein